MRASDAKLSAALKEAGCPEMAERAAAGYWNEFFGDLATPIVDLCAELATIGTKATLALRERVMKGEFDATDAEVDEWSRTPEAAVALNPIGKRHD